jgi:hypothetical protein
MVRRICLGMLGAMLLASVQPAYALSTLETFDTPPAGWVVDRYPPAGFTAPVAFGGDNRLQITISENDGAGERPPAYVSTFYNTQGMQKPTGFNSIYMSIDMYISSTWVNDPNRVGGLWATGVDGGNVTSLFPILEWAGGQVQGWNNGVFIPLGLPAGFTPDTWITLAFLLDTANDVVKYYVNGVLEATIPAFGTHHFKNTIVQAINTTDGINRSLYFDNLLNSTEVPIPGAAILFASALAAMGLLGARRRKQQASPAAA